MKAKKLIEAYTPADLGRLFAVLRQMVAEGVTDKYAIGGAVGASFYAQPAATEDVDVFITFPESGALIDPTEVTRWFVQRGAVVDGTHLIVFGWRMQLLPAGNSLMLEALREAVTHTVAGGSVRVFTLEHLAAICLQLGREKDVRRLPVLLAAETFDKKKFDKIIKKHGLASKWAEFKMLYINRDL